jgi:hypothetical protein
MEDELRGVDLLVVLLLVGVSVNNWRDFLVMEILSLSMIFVLWITSKLFANKFLQFILNFCGIYGAIGLVMMYKNKLHDIGDFLSDHISYYKTLMVDDTVHYIQANQADIKFYNEVRRLNYHLYGILIDFTNSIYNYTVKFVERCWQVLNYVRYIYGCFYGNILQLVTLLDAQFPGGIIGSAMLLLFVIIVIKLALVQRRFHRLLEENIRCMEDKQILQLKLEDIKLLWQKETETLNQDLEKLRVSNLSLEQERDERLCRICQDQIKTIVLLPCQHMCLCKPCLDRKKWKKCPMCRQRVESIIEVYV